METWINMSDSYALKGLEAPLNFIASFAEFITTQYLLPGGPINFKVTPNRVLLLGRYLSSSKQANYCTTRTAINTRRVMINDIAGFRDGTTHSIPPRWYSSHWSRTRTCYMTYTPSPKKKHWREVMKRYIKTLTLEWLTNSKRNIGNSQPQVTYNTNKKKFTYSIQMYHTTPPLNRTKQLHAPYQLCTVHTYVPYPSS